jgi:CheY-like chemotaxis protein/HPt (histidine-containing phosphotransfer) domain-containing protein
MEPAADLEFLPIFREEASERLDNFVKTLRELDVENPAPEGLDILRREAHTIKGAAGMVGLTHAHQLAHALEDVCRAAREDGGALGDDLVEVLHRAADALRAAIEGSDDANGKQRAHLAAVSTNGNGHAQNGAAEVLKLLVVDDSFTLRELQRRILERAGYRVELAEDGRDALVVLEEHDDIGMLVTDIDMPELDGFGLIEAVRADERYGSLPVIVVTARDADRDRSHGIELGANEYVVKGALHEQTLLETVARLARALPAAR